MFGTETFFWARVYVNFSACYDPLYKATCAVAVNLAVIETVALAPKTNDSETSP